jgi:WD40 repeat protein/serine/threonine protein kinase
MQSLAYLLTDLRDIQLLPPETLERVEQGLRGRSANPEAVAKAMVQRGWLTPFQAEQLLEGQAQALVVGPYHLLEPVGEGGMGQVYKARHKLMNRIVALKLIRPEYLMSPAALSRFRREVQAVAKLTHPNIVLAFDAAEIDGTHILVMEYIEGTDLARLEADQGPLPWATACEYVRQAALGLQHAHDHALVHRDIKPSNLMLDTLSGRIKLLDLGLSRTLNGDAEQATNLTQSGALMGTPDYLAPEQALDPHGVDIRADIYSLGCTFYHILTGRPPFAGDSALEKIIKHREIEPVPVEVKRPDVPRGLGLVLKRMLAKRPEDRYQTPAEVAQALEPFVGEIAQGPSTLFPTNTQSSSRVINLGGISLQVEDESELRPGSKSPSSTTLLARRDRMGNRKRRAGIVAGLAALAILGVVALFIVLRLQTEEGTLEIRLSEPDVEVRVDGKSQTIDVNSRTVGPIALKADREHKLEIRRGDEVLRTEWFKLRKGKQEIIDARWIPRDAAEVEAKAKTNPNTKETSPPAVVSDSPSPPTPPTPAPEPPAIVSESPASPTTQPTVARAPVIDRLGTWQPGMDPDAWPGLIPRPARFPGVKRWQVETVAPRSFVSNVAWSPDSRFVACTGFMEHVRIYDAQTLRLVRLFPFRRAWDTPLAWDPKGRWLAVAAAPRTIRLWDVTEGKEGPNLGGLPGRVETLAWSPDGSRLAASGSWNNGSIRLWDTSTWHEVASNFQGQDEGGDIHGLAWSPDGTRLAATFSDQTVRIWKVPGGESTRVIPSSAHNAQVQAVVWSPDSRCIAYGTGDTVRIWNVAQDRAGPTLNAPGATVQGLAWSPNGRHILASCSDGEHRMWDLNNDGQRDPSFRSKTYLAGSTVSFSPDGKRLAASAGGNGLLIWEASKPEPEPLGKRTLLEGMAFSPDGRRLASALPSGAIPILNAKDGRLIAALRGHHPRNYPPPVRSLAFSPDSQRLASAGVEAIRIWNLDTGTPERPLVGGAPFNAVAWSPDGRQLVSGGNDGRVRIWNVRQGTQAVILGDTPSAKRRARSGAGSPILAVAWSPDGRRIAAGSTDRMVWLWSATDGSPEPILPESEGAIALSALAWSPDSRRLVASNRQIIRIWDIADRESLVTLPGSKDVSGLAWSPDGNWLATGTENAHNVGVWDIAAGKAVAEFREHQWSYIWVAWGPDSRRIASSGWDGQICLWDREADHPLLWVAVALPDERFGARFAAFSAAGEWLHPDPALEEQFIYVVESPEGRIELLAPREFRLRTGN